MVAAEGCANGFPDINLINNRASKYTNGPKRVKSELSLANVFICRGTLTGLVLGVDVRTETNDRNLFPEVSLWRKVDSDDSEQGYDIVSGSERTVRLTPTNFSSSGVFHFLLDPPLGFKANDVLVWKQPKDRKSVVRMYTIKILDSSTSDETKHSYTVLLLYPVTGEVQLYTCLFSSHI